MFRKKWKKVVAWIVAGLILLSIGGVVTANYVINKFIDSIAMDTESDLKSDTNVIKQNRDFANNEDVPEKNSNMEQTEDINNTKTQSPSTSAVPEKVQAQNTGDPDSVNTYSPNVSTKKIVKVKESVTIKDKAYVTEILLKNLDLSSIRKLQELAKDGLTVAEKKEARNIIMSKVTSDEYNELSEIGKKYGVSEGRNYDQIKKSLEDD